MAAIDALRYREKARELYEASAAAGNDELRHQFVRLARQYELLAVSAESMGDPDDDWGLTPA